MPSWINEVARFDRLAIGRAYSRREAAEAMSVSIPNGTRDWSGIVRFKNAIALFVTLEKGAQRYAKEHRYGDQFKDKMMYWDSRARQDRTSSQVKALCEPSARVIVFARVREKFRGRTQPFLYLGRAINPRCWGEKPVRFTWVLQDFDRLAQSPEWPALAIWEPPNDSSLPTISSSANPRGARLPPTAPPGYVGSEGDSIPVTVNRYERDPRARSACIDALGCKCSVCGFDFGIAYGSLGAGFIFVHHRVPVAVRAQAGEYELDPVRDLVPICGNCHAMVHRKVSIDVFSAGSPGLSIQAAGRLLELRRVALEIESEAIDGS